MNVHLSTEYSNTGKRSMNDAYLSSAVVQFRDIIIIVIDDDVVPIFDQRVLYENSFIFSIVIRNILSTLIRCCTSNAGR